MTHMDFNQVQIYACGSWNKLSVTGDWSCHSLLRPPPHPPQFSLILPTKDWKLRFLYFNALGLTFVKEDTLIPSTFDSAIVSPPTPFVGCLHAYFCYINACEATWVTESSTHQCWNTNGQHYLKAQRDPVVQTWLYLYSIMFHTTWLSAWFCRYKSHIIQEFFGLELRVKSSWCNMLTSSCFSVIVTKDSR